jgi:hypothetical protein
MELLCFLYVSLCNASFLNSTFLSIRIGFNSEVETLEFYLWAHEDHLCLWLFCCRWASHSCIFSLCMFLIGQTAKFRYLAYSCHIRGPDILMIHLPDTFCSQDSENLYSFSSQILVPYCIPPGLPNSKKITTCCWNTEKLIENFLNGTLNVRIEEDWLHISWTKNQKHNIHNYSYYTTSDKNTQLYNMIAVHKNMHPIVHYVWNCGTRPFWRAVWANLGQIILSTGDHKSESK